MSMLGYIKTIDSLFPNKEEMGLQTPADRTEYFTELWEQWEATEIDLKNQRGPELYGVRFQEWTPTEKLKEFAKKHNIKQFWEYQIRGNKVRFKSEDVALLFKLS